MPPSAASVKVSDREMSGVAVGSAKAPNPNTRAEMASAKVMRINTPAMTSAGLGTSSLCIASRLPGSGSK